MQDDNTITPSRRRFLEQVFAATVMTVAAPTIVLGRLVPTIGRTNGVLAGRFRIDLTDPKYIVLTEVGGSLMVTRIAGTSKRAIVTRTDADTFVAVNPTCTHLGCLVDDAIKSNAGGLLECPCHGSQFEPNGVVARGPAVINLTSYATFFDGATFVDLEIPGIADADVEQLNTAFASAAMVDSAGSLVSVELVLEHSAAVSVRIVDAAGTAIKTLQEGMLSAGPHTLRGPVGDLSSGAYFLRIEMSGRAIIARKFVVSR